MLMCNVLTAIPVCLPSNSDDYIQVGFPVKIHEKDDYGHYVRIDTQIKEAIQRQAEIFKWNGKTTYIDGAVLLSGSLSKEEQAADKYNSKLVEKLKQYTRYDFYNKKR